MTNKIEEIHVDSYNKLNLHANVLKNTGKVGMAFAENDFKVIVRPDAEKSEFLPQEKLIVLHKDNKSEIYKQMGYFWNFLCDNIYDLNKAKYSVYKAEKKKIDSKLSEADYIAITYQMFVSKPKTLKNKCPKTYNFMYKYARELQQSQVEYAMFDYYNNHEYIVE